MYWYATQPYFITQGFPQGYGELVNLYREIERQRMLSRQILSLVRENHRLLSLLYSKQSHRSGIMNSSILKEDASWEGKRMERIITTILNSFNGRG